ncbi:MAG: hypothetical protein HRU15_11675 [Planctomycetes bacterium]|nr:hypothetical protein [Planctomycetota bacterium]
MLRFASKRADISPQNYHNLTMSGMQRLIPTRGIMDAIRCEIAVLSNDDLSVCVVTIDQVFISERHYEEIRLRLHKYLPDAQLMLTCPHDHSATAIAFDRDHHESEADVEAAVQCIFEKFEQALSEVIAAMVPVQVAAQRFAVEEPLGMCRRAVLNNGSCVTAWGAGAIIPPGHKYVGKSSPDSKWIDVLCFKALDADQPMAVMSSYSSHIHFYELPYFTGEAAGAAKMEMELRYPEVHMMYGNAFAGASSLQFAHPIPVDDEEARIRWQQESSQHFAKSFIDAINKNIAELEYRDIDDFTYDSFYEADNDIGDRQGRMHIDTLRIGPFALCTIPGEMFIEYEESLRNDLPCEQLLVMSYNRSFLGYVAPALSFEQGSYECMRGPADAFPLHEASRRIRSATTTGDRIVQITRSQIIKLYHDNA